MDLFAKVLLTVVELSGGWVDFVHRWLVLVRPMTRNEPSPAAFVPALDPGVGAERAPAVAHEGAAGHLHLADEVPAVGQRAGANRVTMSIRPLITKTCWPIDLR